MKDSTGYDAAQSERDQDDLDRWRFASEIVDVIKSTPPDWSARIGVFGKWGEGKSTVLRFAAQMLREQQDIVFGFDPWATQSWNDLWGEFGSCLFEALSDAQIDAESSLKQAVKRGDKWLESSGLKAAGEMAAGGVSGGRVVYNTAFGVLRQWLKPDGAQIQRVREKLGERRVVVLIDDLDRCAPELVPQMLLSLRELLDLPGFTFVLAFDDEIVGNVLTERNRSWPDGSDFLEKILDFRFHLPPVTELQKQRLVRRAIKHYCPFLPKDSVKAIQDLLPDNPRKLKALIRTLAALRTHVERHDAEELNWADIWLAQLLRLESYPFFERLLRENVLEGETGLVFAMRKRVRERSGEKEDENQSLRTLIQEAGVNDSGTSERLIQLIEATRARASSKFRYACELTLRPHAVTWKEFRQLRDLWVADRRSSTLADWITRHANERALSIDDVQEEVFSAVLAKRQELLSSAADATSIDDHESHARDARILVQMLDQCLLDLNMLSATRFARLYQQCRTWIGWCSNPADLELRREEESLLLRVINSADREVSCGLLEIVQPKSPFVDRIGDSPEGNRLKQELSKKCTDILAPKAASEALALFSRENGIRSLWEDRHMLAQKYCLFHRDSPVWKSEMQRDLVNIIESGCQDSVVYHNTHSFLDLLLSGRSSGLGPIGAPNFVATLSDEAFVRSLWKTITSRSIQYRMQLDLIKARTQIIAGGIPEEALPLPQELQKRVQVEEERRAEGAEGTGKYVEANSDEQD